MVMQSYAHSNPCKRTQATALAAAFPCSCAIEVDVTDRKT
jgi:hypothetical protein